VTTEVLQGWLLSGSTLWMLVDAPTEGALCDPVKRALLGIYVKCSFLIR
jgi:hypothetical protein